MSHKELIKDADPIFEIDPITRAIKNTSTTKTTVIQFDHNSERFTFTLPRYIEEHDILECNRVEVHYLNQASNTKGVYEVEDLAADPDNEEKVKCTWLLSQNATQATGVLHFLLRFTCVQPDGTIDYAWNTGIHTGITITSGIYNTDANDANFVDILTQWKSLVIGNVDEIVGSKLGYTIGYEDKIDTYITAGLYKIIGCSENELTKIFSPYFVYVEKSKLPPPLIFGSIIMSNVSVIQYKLNPFENYALDEKINRLKKRFLTEYYEQSGKTGEIWSEWEELNNKIPISPLKSYSDNAYYLSCEGDHTTVYKTVITNDITFVLPDHVENEFYQFLVCADIQEIVSINWGNSVFFTDKIPDIDIGRYDLIFEWDGTGWCVGAIKKGAVE